MNLKFLIIGPSHYCEKSRLSLEKAGIAFEEEGHAPFFHIPAVRSAGGNRTTPVLLTSDSIQKDSVELEPERCAQCGSWKLKDVPCRTCQVSNANL